MADDKLFDLLVIGGGINGCGIARDAAGRGYSVMLAEMNDLASGTSSASTKLIHGGLRYLEHYEFRLVREALAERNVLWRNAPHIIRPMRFVLPLHKGLRPAWLIRLGLVLYDTMGGTSLLPGTRSLDLHNDPVGKPLKDIYTRAFEYSDACVDDARLVVLNAMDAAARGAVIRTHTKVIAAQHVSGHWVVTLHDTDSGREETVLARMLVNAAGPWADSVLASTGDESSRHKIRLVKGSHIVVARKFNDPRAYFFQNGDGRIFFAIPYENNFTLIGTTDEDYVGDPAAITISNAEIFYLCQAANKYFKEPINSSDIVWSFAGIRPLYNDGVSAAQDATRDYVLKVDRVAGAPILNIFGGKITTFRRLAEAALDAIGTQIGAVGRSWTSGQPLPGGDFPVQEFDRVVIALLRAYPFLERAHAKRLARLYGTLAPLVLGTATSKQELGQCFGGDLYECELRYLWAQEWARSGEDVLWRRTKLGLHLSAQEQAAVSAFMRQRAGKLHNGRHAA